MLDGADDARGRGGNFRAYTVGRRRLVPRLNFDAHRRRLRTFGLAASPATTSLNFRRRRPSNEGIRRDGVDCATSKRKITVLLYFITVVQYLFLTLCKFIVKN